MNRRVLSVVACLSGVLALTGGVRLLAAPLAFRLLDTTGAVHTERELSEARAVVLFFITPDCPISQSYVPEMNRIAQAYASQRVRVFAVQSDLTSTADDVRRHVSEYGYRFPVLEDPKQLLVSRTGATITPEAVVMNGSGTVLYRGRIDNRVVSLGTKRVQATEFDLRNALDAVLAGKPVVHSRTTAYGCLIPRPS